MIYKPHKRHFSNDLKLNGVADPKVKNKEGPPARHLDRKQG